MIVTIDGPAGSGKSTAARNLARRLGVAYLDTGATFRAATLKAMRENVDLSDEQALAATARDMQLDMQPTDNGLRVLLDGADVTDEIRTRKVTENAHHAAGSPAVREVLAELQRQIGRRLGSFITEGRDQGSVVFPDADVKFYLSAHAEIRAMRRCEEMRSRGEDVEFEEVLHAIEQRDNRDRSREVAPLARPQGALEIDTSHTTPDEVADALQAAVEAAR
jgi:cytidylate kinase